MVALIFLLGNLIQLAVWEWDQLKVFLALYLITLGIGVPLGMFFIQTWGIAGSVAMVTLWYLTSHAFSFGYLVRALGKR